MLLAVAIGFVVIMLVAMYIEADRRSRQADLRPVAAPPSPPKRIAPAVRAELDDTPLYWDTRFHQLLASIDAPSVVGERIETIAWSGELMSVWEDRAYPECPCPRCRRICRG